MNKRCLAAALFLFVACVSGVLLFTTHAHRVPHRLVRIVFRENIRNNKQNAAHTFSNAEAVESQQQIPKVLHHVYLDGLDNLKQAEIGAVAKPGQRFPGYNSTWRYSCHTVHREWQYMFWNMSQAEHLIRTSYPWFLDTFHSYNNNVQKGSHIAPYAMDIAHPSVCQAVVHMQVMLSGLF